MKKLLLLFVAICSITASAQIDYSDVINGAGTSQNGRAPQGARSAGRSVWIITAAEMSAAGFVAGDVVAGLGFNYSAAQDVTTDGTFSVYMENTTDASNSKSTSWATAISTMTLASSGSITVPNVTGTFDIPFTGGSTFTYTGDAVYVAFDYQNLANPVSGVANTALCDNTPVGGSNGLLGAMSAAGSTTPPATLASSAFRPNTRLGKVVACPRPQGLSATTTLNSADLSWTSTASIFDIEYGSTGFTQGSGTLVTGLTTNAYTINSLTSGTEYDFYVRADCGGGSLSAWSGAYTFLTKFAPADPTYTTDFNVTSYAEIGWLENPVRNATNAGWFVNVSAGLSQDGDDHTAVAISSATATADSRLFSRGINLRAGYQATIDYYIQNYQATGSTNLANYDLTVGSAQDAISQTTTIASEPALTNAAGAFVEKTFTFNTPADGVYYFSFWNKSPANATGTHAIILDAFTVSEALLGTKDFLASKFSVSPNPATNVIRVTNSENISVKGVVISDLNGRVVKSNTYNDASNIQVNVSDLASGMYLMKITSDKGVATKKIVKN